MYIPSLENERKILASILPTGQFWRAKNKPGYNIYELIKALASVYNQFRYYLNDKQKELVAPQISQYIELWEQMVGIPDTIFTKIPDTLEERIRLVMIKLVGLKSHTKAEVLNLLQKMYPEITDLRITPGIERMTFGATFPLYFASNRAHTNQYVFIKIVGLDTANTFGNNLFPVPFMSSKIDTVKAILEAVKPFNKRIFIES